MTADGSWMFYYDLELMQQSSQWKTSNLPVPKKAKVMCSAGKVIMIIFFFWWRWFSVSAHCISKPHCYSSVSPRSLAKNDRPFLKNALTKRLKKFLCITTLLTHMMHTPSLNFWRNVASELFRTLHIAQTLPHGTSGYSQKLKKPCVEWGF